MLTLTVFGLLVLGVLGLVIVWRVEEVLDVVRPAARLELPPVPEHGIGPACVPGRHVVRDERMTCECSAVSLSREGDDVIVLIYDEGR